MPDDPLPFYAPGFKIPPRQPKPGEPLWQIRVNDVTWSCELRDHDRWGVEAQILRAGELVIGRRFDLRELAVRWAEKERAAIEPGAK